MNSRRVLLIAVPLVVALTTAAVALGVSESDSGPHRADSPQPVPSNAPLPSLRIAVPSSGSSTAVSQRLTTSAPTFPPPTSSPITSSPTTSKSPTSTSQPSLPTPPVSAAGAPGDSLAAASGKTVVIDAGHNGGNWAHSREISRSVFIGTQTRACDTTGTATSDGYSEAAYNLDVASRLGAVLRAAGAHVVMVRTTNDGWGPCIDERAQIGNRAHADVAISIHADGGPAGGRGFHVNMPASVPGYTDDIYVASHRLGVDVRDAFGTTGMPTSTYIGSLGLVERSDLGGLNLSDVPKVLIESGNMRNVTDVSLLESPDFRQREAQALATGIARYLANR